MKRLIIILCIFSSSIFAQTESRTANASVNLIKPLSIVPVAGEIDFGEIILTGTPFTVDLIPRNGKLFEITGQPNRQVIINFNSVLLDNTAWAALFGSPQGTLLFTPQIITDNNQAVISGGTYALINSGNLAFLDLWVGGSLNITSTQSEGDYTGLFTITVSY